MRNSIESDVPPCVAGQRKKGFSSRFSLRRFIYASPILGQRRQHRSSSSSSRPSTKSQSKDVNDGKPSGSSSRESGGKQFRAEIHQAQSRSSVNTSHTESASSCMECPLCLVVQPGNDFFEISQCGHKACMSCLQQYLRVQITESRVCILCPVCSESMHPNEIRSILNDELLFAKYEDFMVRRVLAVDPDTRWCPAPDCSFAVIASECASCPKLKCERPGCNSYFCYHCKAEWHPNQTCDAARAQRSPNVRSSSITFSQDSQFSKLKLKSKAASSDDYLGDDIKPCPRCQVLIVKMDDGSCNHMMCAVCGAEFCWLCMKEISDLHYLSPSGCTFWGKKPWSRKKKILWQLGTLVGAPVGIALVAGITVPAMIIGIPVWVGRKLYGRYKNNNKHKRNAAIVGGVMASVLISPILAGLAVGIGVPILLFYVYGVVPVSLCRSGGCGGATGILDDVDITTTRNGDTVSMDAVSQRVANPSIGEASLVSGSQMLRDVDRESASTVALAGSVGAPTHKLEVQADLVSAQRLSISSLSDKSVNVSLADDGGASTRALAGSMLNYKGSDSCSCVMNGEDCISERIHLEDMSAAYTAEGSSIEKASISSNCSYRTKCGKSWSRGDKDTISNDSIFLDMPPVVPEDKPRKTSMATLRSQFFLAENKPKSFEDRVIIEVSNETLDRQASWEQPKSPSCSTSYTVNTTEL